MTNSEWIRSHDDEWLADFIAEGEAVRRVEMAISGADGKYIVKEYIEDWLKQEYVDSNAI
jgi:hypothetical protein